MKFHKLITLISFITIGITSFWSISKRHHFESNERAPSSVEASCLELVSHFQKSTKTIPSTHELDLFFKELEKEHSVYLSRMSDEVQEDYKVLNVVKENISSSDISSHIRSVNMGQVLFERNKLGDSTTKILIELGYKEEDGMLLPPKDLVSLYLKIYEKLTAAAGREGVGSSEIIYPTFLFENDKKEILFIRVGIDKIPSRKEGWRFINNNEELNEDQFAKMISEKKMLLTPAMISHDIGHVVDLIEYPKYAPAYKVFQETKMSASFPSPANGDIGKFFNEWLYLPSIQNYDKVKTLIPSLVNGKTSITDITKAYKKIKTPELMSQAEIILKERYTLFSNFGGGARDWFTDRYVTYRQIRESFKIIQNDDPALYKKGAEGSFEQMSSYMAFEAPALFKGLEYIVAYKNGKHVPAAVASYFSQGAMESGKKLDKYTDDLLINYLAHIEYRLQSAMSLKITPDQVAEDFTLFYKDRDGWKEYKKTRTYQYYQTYPVGSIQWFKAVDVAR